MPPASTLSWLGRILAQGVQPPDLVPAFHRELLAATGGRMSLVLERSMAAGGYTRTSSAGTPGGAARPIEADDYAELDRLAASGPAVTRLTGATLCDLDGARALIVPLASHRRTALLVITEPRVPDREALAIGLAAAVELRVALDWSRLVRENRAHRALHELSIAFARDITTPSGAAAALATFARDANALLGSARTTIWLHDRRARELGVASSSDPGLLAAPARIPDDDDGAPPARGRRLEAPEFVQCDTGPVLVAPLRGWRRGLGTLVIEGSAGSSLEEELFCTLAHEMARQLSAALENVQLVGEILRQRQSLEDTFNSLPDLLVVTDRALRVVQVNDEFVHRLRQPREQIFERLLADVTGTGLADWAAGAARGRSATGGRAQAAGAADAGSRTFENLPFEGVFVATLTPLVSDGGEITGHVVALRDVTLQTRLESEREALRARLSQSEKLAALGQFVAGIAHEMNNPLQGLLGHLELLMAHTDAARPVRTELRKIHREGERAARIVGNLLVFAGGRRMTRRRLRIERVLARALASRRTALARAHIDLVRDVGTAVPAVLGDPLLLQQAFLNVLINAEHAIRERDGAGTIELTTRTDASRRVITTVRDTGAGISPEILPRIFDPFFTTRDAGRGTGLGLAVTYGIIQEHGGTIHAANAPGGGAVFTVELPGAPQVKK